MNFDPSRSAETNEDSYYVSITDMLIGLLFLFILLLMYFAVQLRMTTESLITSDQTRTELLEKVAIYLREKNVAADVDFAAGVLRLPNEILFEKARDAPTAAGAEALHVLANAMSVHLPCYAFRLAPKPTACGDVPHHLEAIFIEGHTDSDPMSPTPRLRDNWDLSSARASNTWRIIVADEPGLAEFVSGPSGSPGAQPIFSVAGYADQRPIALNRSEEAKASNRRIDVRFVMAAPSVNPPEK